MVPPVRSVPMYRKNWTRVIKWSLSTQHLSPKQYNVERAPFFVVEEAGKDAQIYTVYLKFAKEVLAQKTEESAELKEIMENNQDLDFL